MSNQKSQAELDDDRRRKIVADPDNATDEDKEWLRKHLEADLPPVKKGDDGIDDGMKKKG